jgi:hypothetical protein
MGNGRLKKMIKGSFFYYGFEEKPTEGHGEDTENHRDFYVHKLCVLSVAM